MPGYYLESSGTRILETGSELRFQRSARPLHTYGFTLMAYLDSEASPPLITDSLD